jgi:hypothetical protein
MFNVAEHRAMIGASMDTAQKGMIGIRASVEDRAAWQAAADADGRSLSAWIVRRCNGEPTTEPVRSAIAPAPAKPVAKAKRKAR